jgi:CspA family cold shock protein
LAGLLGRFALDVDGARFRFLSPKIEKLVNRPCRCGSIATCHMSKGQNMTPGTVKFYNDQKGFGFIQPDGGGKDVFVHATALERAGISGLREGQKVNFDTETDRRTGKIAVGKLEAV